MNITGRILLKNILLVSVLTSTDFIFENAILDASALTTRKALNAAVKKERDSWQSKLNESQNKIKSLQTDLDNAFNENKKIQNEKAASEKSAKDNLMKITTEKENALQELTASKKSFEENSKKLNETIDKLQAEKEKLENDISQQKESLKTAQKEYEEKIKAEQENAKKTLEEEKNRLNKQISEKTNQLNKTIETLKALNNEYSNAKTASNSEEVKHLVEIEVLKSELNKQKIELKTLINLGKNQDETKATIINNLKTKINTLSKEFENLVENIKSAELKNLVYIEKLTAKLNMLKEKTDILIKTGKTQEKNLLMKIKILIKKQKETQNKYIAIMEAYQNEEQKNLILIDKLKSDLNRAINKNKAFLNIAKRINEEKIKEDIADSESEANQLLKIDTLNSKLQDSIRKNSMLIKNNHKLKNNVDNLKNLTQKSHLELSNKVKDLTNKLNDSNKKLNQLKKLYNNSKIWIKEINSLNPMHLNKIFNVKNTKISTKNLLNKNHDIFQILSDTPTINQKFSDFNIKNQIDISNETRNPLYDSETVISQNHPINNMSNFNKQIIPQKNLPTEKQQPGINFNGFNVPAEKLQPNINFNDLNTPAGKQQPGINVINNKKNTPSYQNLEKKVSQNNPKNLQNQMINNNEIIKVLDSKSITQTKDEKLVDFAIESIINAVQKMTNANERKTNASMNLIGAGHELPEKIDAVVNVIKEQFNPDVLNKALDKLSSKYTQKQNFIDESLKHMYGNDGSKIVNW